MSIDNNYINQITIDCLINKDHYNRSIKNKMLNSYSRKEKKFYKKRIMDMTRDLLSKQSVHEEKILLDVKQAYEAYIKACIDYFKILDNNDILQEEYKNMDALIDINGEKTFLADSQIPNTQEEANMLLMRTINVVKPSLDKFVKIISKKPEVESFIPKQKDIDLKDPILKSKGIIKRENKKENINK